MKLLSTPKSILSRDSAFSLVEVTLALGLMSYVLLGLLGLMAVGLNSNKESTLESAMSQIALHIASTYDSSAPVTQMTYAYSGQPVESSDPDFGTKKYFTAEIKPQPAGEDAAGSAQVQMISVTISTVVAPTEKKVFLMSAFVPLSSTP